MNYYSMRTVYRTILRIQLVVLAILLSPMSFAEQLSFFVTDLQGSPIVEFDKSGHEIWRETYEPYGKRVVRDAASSTNDLWFVGRSHDDDTGLSYLMARYYDPDVGRFMAIDPAGFTEKNAISFNRYAYGNNNPLLYSDPNGDVPLDTFVDVGFLVFDGGKAIGYWTAAAITGNPAYTATAMSATLDAGLDVVGIVTPYVPAPALKIAARAGKNADSVASAAKQGAKNSGKGKGGIASVKKGREGVEQYKEMLKKKGYEIKGTEVSIVGPDGRVRIYDILSTKDGKWMLSEVKNGPNARTTKRQGEIDPMVAGQGGTVKGKRAQEGFEKDAGTKVDAADIDIEHVFIQNGNVRTNPVTPVNPLPPEPPPIGEGGMGGTGGAGY